MSGRLLRVAAILALAPFVAGAHCREDCGAPAVSLVAGRNLERTLYGPGVFATRPMVSTLATSIGLFERRELRIDASRPVAVLLAHADAARALARLDGSKLQLGERTEGYRVVALLEQAGRVPLFMEPGTLSERWDAVVLVPRDRRGGPWQAAVAVELGRRVERRNDPENGRCVEAGPPGPPVPEWVLMTLSGHCGDGTRQDDEECDDGNRNGGDGCSPYCFRER